MKSYVKFSALICAVILTLTSLASCSVAGLDFDLSEILPEGILPNIGRVDVIPNVTVLNGTTGFGAAKLIEDTQNGKTVYKYNFTVESDAANVTAGLINGSIDIAALPTNAAATVYNKTNGAVKIAAVNTLGVLYLVTNGDNVTVNSISDLDGKTVYCPAQNPAFIFQAICEAHNINVTIDTAFAQPADLRAALIAGKVDIAVLPEPMVTIAKSASSNLVTSLDLTEEWEKLYGENTLMQGCIVVRTEWAEANPEALATFLEEYEGSVKYTVKNPAEASEIIVSTGVFAGKAPVAAKAIPNCNIVYIDGHEMASSLSIFFEKLYNVSPKAVGGKLPDSGIYLEK